MSPAHLEVFIDCFIRGWKLLDSNPKLARLVAAQDGVPSDWASPEQIANFLTTTGKPSYLNNADLFFSILHYGVMRNFKVDREISRLKRLERPDELISSAIDSTTLLRWAIDTNSEFGDNAHRYLKMRDSALKLEARNAIVVKETSICGPLRPQMFTKINHGYWEFLLNSFAEVTDHGRFRDLSKSSHPRNWKRSGFHAALSLAFAELYREDNTPKDLKVGVNLGAGDRPFSADLDRPLTPVSRGALAGLLCFIQSSIPNPPVHFVDGSAPRAALRAQQFDQLFDVDLRDFDAILLLVPPPLKSLIFKHYSGSSYLLTIPGRVAHETYRVSLPLIIGAVQKIMDKHRSVCLITQSAVLAPLIAIFLNEIFKGRTDPISFLDLGRVLDVARPELVPKIPSLSWLAKDGFQGEISRFVALDDSPGNVGLGRL